MMVRFVQDSVGATWDLQTFDWFRLASIGICLGTFLQMLTMLSHYWLSMRSVREEFGDRVIAPSFGWTFLYHATVAVLALCIALGEYQGVEQNLPPVCATYLFPFVLAVLAFVASRFLKYYSKSIRAHKRRIIQSGGGL